MDKLKKYFLKLDKEFIEKKPFLLRKIGRWKKGHKASLYKQARLLFNEAQQCEKEIHSVFESDDWKYNKPFLKVKIQAFGGLCHELCAMTTSPWKRFVEFAFILIVMVFVFRTFFFGVFHVPTSSAEPTLLVGDRVWGNKILYFFQEPKVGDMVMFEDPNFIYDQESVWQRLWQRNIGRAIPFVGLKAGPQSMAKRIIAVPGDVIEGRIEEGKPVVYRNGKKFIEPYVNTYPLLAIKKVIGFFEREKIGSTKIPEFLRKHKKIVLYSYDPKKDFEEQPFYYIDYQNVLYDKYNRYMKMYKSGVPATNKSGKSIDVFGPYIVPKGKYWVAGDNRRNSVDSREWGFLDNSRITGKASFVIWSLDSEEAIWLLEFLKNPFGFLGLLRWSRFFKKIQ